jgi:hypothetical protein
MIPIYKHEQSDGLADKIKASLVVAYYSPVAKIVDEDKWFNPAKATKIHVCASAKDSDLYHLKSILVSSVWNKNDDVFSVEEIFRARHTPIHKPDNYEHDEHIIVGHMTDSWVIDQDLNPIPDDIFPENLPEKIHILTSSVLYLRWEDEELQKKVAEIISGAESGTMYVSMECMLEDFDYAVMEYDAAGNQVGECKIVARNDDTSFLTKHLRCYGGDGRWDKYHVGRLLKNISFCGKGYTKTPANPESVIVTASNIDFVKATKINSFLNEGGVIDTCTSNTTENTMNELEELKAKVLSLETAKAELETKVAELVEANKKVADLTTELEAAKSALDAAKKELAEIAAAKAHAARVEKLSDVLEASEVEDAVKKFASLDDAQFDEMVKLLSMTKKKYSEMEDKKDKKGEKHECANTAEASLSPAPGSDAAPKTGLKDAVASLLNHKKKNKNGDK